MVFAAAFSRVSHGIGSEGQPVSGQQNPPALQNGNGPAGRKVVDFEADVMRPIKVEGDSSVLNLIGKVVFFHNGAVITCDSAIRYSDKRMECFGNVVINKDNTYIYGDRADYNGDINIARVYAPIIKMVDQEATMYTYNFSFNTLTNIGSFSGGATISNKDNLLESERGYYNTKTRIVTCVERVEIENPDYRIKSDSVGYNMDTDEADFFVKSYIWNKKGEILSAERGRYLRNESQYYFYSDAYILTDKQELWADSIDYNSVTEDAFLRRNIQVRDEEQSSMAFGDKGRYWGKKEELLLTIDPSLLSYDEQQDTLYVRSDTIFVYTISRREALKATEKPVAANTGEEELISAPVRGKSTLQDSVMQVAGDTSIKRDSMAASVGDSLATTLSDSATVAKAAGDAGKGKYDLRKARREERKREKEARRTAKENKVSERNDRHDAPEAEPKVIEAGTRMPLSGDGVKKPVADSMTMEMIAADSVDHATVDGLPAGTFKGIEADTVATMKRDSVQQDSMVRIVRGYRNVRIFRSDVQGVCDSIVGFSIDSTLHMYIEPVLWNELNQIKADVIDLYSRNQQVEKAVFTGTPIMSSEADSVRYNQVKGKIIEALFRDNEIYRTDVKGNGQTYYFMQEDGDPDIIGFMTVECADITFNFEERQLVDIIYRGAPVYAIYPMDKIPAEQSLTLPGFVWEIDRKPSKSDVFNRMIRPSQRLEYEAMPEPLFPVTKSIKADIDRKIHDGVWRDRNDLLSPEALDFIRSLGY